MNTKELAQILDQAAFNAQSVEQLSLSHKISEEDAYAIQAASMEERYTRGERLIGLKMGFTSKAKMEQMGVHDMIWGRLTDGMLIEEGGNMDFSKFIHPRAEPEICFLVKKKIDRQLSLEEAPEYVEAVATAIEIIDSRYMNFKFSLEDVIADNCSSSGLVVGGWKPAGLPIDDLKITLEIDGKIVHEGSSSAILGNPWESFIAATRLAVKYEEEINEGALIMAGAATPAVYLEKGQTVSATVARLGTVGFSVV
ncbi:MAG: fumarylacetoacetate hydrolase family protein [Bacteroidota bacterium]